MVSYSEVRVICRSGFRLPLWRGTKGEEKLDIKKVNPKVDFPKYQISVPLFLQAQAPRNIRVQS